VTYDRARLEAELVRDEGERFRVYRCTANKLSIGVGRNLDDVGISAKETQLLGLTKAGCIANGISRSDSRALLANDIDGCERDLDRRLPWWRALNAVRQRVLMNMCFNLGISRLLGFRNTLRKMAAGDYAGAAAGMAASLWYDQVGVRAKRLVGLMESGRDFA
jgi:lysozyme